MSARPLIGAFDAAAWAGLVVCDAPGRGGAIRLVVARDGERADGNDLLNLVHEVGPCAADGSYARVAFDTDLPFGVGDETPIPERATRTPGLTWEWSRVSDDRVVARARVDYHGHLEIRGYFPWDWLGEWKVHRGRLVARWPGDRFALVTVAGPWPIHYGTTGTRGGSRAILDRSGEAGLRFSVNPKSTVYLALELGIGEPDGARPAPDPGEVDAILRRAADRYARTRVSTEGYWSDLAPSITNNLHWTVLLQPELGRRYTPAGRRWIFPQPRSQQDHWTIFAWDSFFNALELGVESPSLAKEVIGAVLDTQYPNGNVPNWRGRYGGTPDRSQPPVGSFAVLKQFLRTRDLSLLHESWPALERWSAWWRAPKGAAFRRDGNGNGLFNWGSDLDDQSPHPPPWETHVPPQRYAAWESGQDDLPCWDDANWVPGSETLDLDSVDLNAFIALDLECLSRIAHFRNDPERERAYRERYDALRQRMNDRLWDEERGMYMDRYWDGTFSTRLAASNFLPLLAGIPDRARARRMVEALTDPQHFWGPYVIPTISRADRAFRDQQYWRGSIWPPTNYLVYHGLRRYRFDDTAAAVAKRSVDLFLRTWRTYQLCRENFDSRTGEGAGHRFQSWGPLFALMGLEEFIDVTPWDGLRIGTVDPPPSTTVERIRLAEREWRVTIGPEGVAADADGHPIVASSAPVVLRHVRLDEGSLYAEARAPHPVALSVPAFAQGEVRIDDRVTEWTGARIHLGAGAHRLRVSQW